LVSLITDVAPADVLIMTIGAVLIFPRLAFVTLANNLMVLSIRSMLTEFFCMSSAPIGVKADEVVQS